MKEFMQTHKIYLTPISPIHIGCGEDFEPTNYVIDNNVLYHFEPSQLNLSDKQKLDLINYSNRGDLLAIQRFFLENKQQAVNSAHYFANVATEIAQNWKNKMGKATQQEKDGNKVIANLAIERTAYIPYRNEPYIPGSSFKGALATTLLNEQHKKLGYPKVRKEDSKQLVKNYIGEFADSKLRYVKFSDFVPVSSTHTKIFYSVNFKKIPTEKGGKGKGIALRRECILQSQYRAFCSELALWDNKNNNLTIKEYFKLLNSYYQPIFQKECELLLSRGLIKKEWISAIMALLTNSQVALIRLGKNGADSKVYQGGLAQIKIMKGGKNSEFKPSATTVWLAANQENQSSELLPFGWALLEIDPTSENEPLKKWCSEQLQQLDVFDKINALRDRDARRAEIQAQREAEKQAQQAKALALKAEQEAKEKLLNSASENQRLVIDLAEKIKSVVERQADITGSVLLKEAVTLIGNAVEWNDLDKAYLKENLTIELLKTKIDFKKKDTEKNLKKALNKLDN
ncbi:RAMP superfamily CRISPR-associated protein [Ursidibacter sp. B-7004-1]